MRTKISFLAVLVVFVVGLTVFCSKKSGEKAEDVFLEPALLTISSTILRMNTMVSRPISQTITVTNMGRGDASNLNPTLSSPENSSFSVNNNECAGLTLGSMASCSFTLTFNPKEKMTGILKIMFDYTHLNGENISLPIDIPYETADAGSPGPGFLDWGQISRQMVSSETGGEQNPRQIVKIKLMGDQVANISNISLDPSNPLSITENNCNGSNLSSANPTCQFTIMLTRTSTPMGGNVSVYVDYTTQGESKRLSDIISYNVVYNSKLEFESSIISPMNATVETPSQQTITVMNMGKGSALITSITSDPAGSALSIPFGSSNTCSKESGNVKIGPSGKCVFNVVLSARRAVEGNAKIKLTYNHDDGYTATPLQSTDIAYKVTGEGDGGKCTSVADILTKKDTALAIGINNETNCAYTDDQIYIHFIARSSRDLSRFVVIKNIINEDGHSVAVVGEPDNVNDATVPFFTLADVKNGAFYLQPRSGESVVAIRFYISLGQPIYTLKFRAIDYYDQPVDKTPWDIFEFGFDSQRIRGFGFNTTQVSSFSVPLWFNIIPRTESLSNPNVPLGIKLRTAVSKSVPVYLASQKAIIDRYRTQMANGPKLFSLDFLKESDKDNNIRIRSPSEQPAVGIPPEDKNYFDQNIINFFEFPAYNTKPSAGAPWPFRMCTGDPGPADAITDPRKNYTFPGCASSESICPNINVPQCNYNTCSGVAPDHYRDVGTCFMGYVEDKTKFKFWTYQTDTAPNSSRCEGTVTYNGYINGTNPTVHPPATLCELDLNDILAHHDGALTRCVLENNCIQYIQDRTNDPNYGIFNTYFMASVMRHVSTNYQISTGYTIWGDPKEFYKKTPYNYYSKFWHEISLENMAYGFGYDDAGNQSTTYTPDPRSLSNLIIGVGW